ncbi:hypothetical protein GGI12_004207 [Dipsacomyces acuminosporus]|nr:hypothetical protein GGI12_004207 [Dipsacomyces acuminosporus]
MRTFGSSAAALILSAICLAGASAEDEKSSYRGAILVKNGQQTSCEVALINNKSGFVAANCLDYEGQTQISKTTVHEVYMSSYRDEPPARYRITKYHLSQQYDSSTPANNLAVVRFNDGAIIEWTNPIAVNQEGWKGVQYVRRAMADVGKMKWAETQTDTSSDLTVDSSCKRYSRIYEANANAFWCSNSTALSVYDRNCTISYSLLYAKISSTTYALAGLHSHSVASGANICRDKPQLAYFILLENYLTFAGSVTGMRLDYISGNSSYVPKDDVGYRMKKASGDKPSGLSQFTGNLALDSGNGLGKRAIISADIHKIPGGLLVKNQRQTSCALGIIDNRAAFVAASCFDNIRNGKVDDDKTTYEVFLDDYSDTVPAAYKIDSIHIHPLYNSTTLINNIAVVEYNGSNDKIIPANATAVAMDRKEWTETAFARRYMNNMNNMEWIVPDVKTYKDTSPLCYNASRVFNKNPDAFLCTALVSPSGQPSCQKAPYQLGYSSVDKYIVMSALFSHTVTYNESMCVKNVAMLSYFTLLSNYVGFAVDVLKRPVTTVVNKNQEMVEKSSLFSMNSVDFPKVEGVSLYTGDLTPTIGLGSPSKSKKPDSSDSNSDTESSSTVYSASSSSPTKPPTSQPSSPVPGSYRTKNGLTTTQTIVIGTVVPIVSIIILIVLFFLYKQWQKKNKKVYVDPQRDSIGLQPNNPPLYSMDHPASDSQYYHPPMYGSHDNFPIQLDTKIHA